MLIPNMDREMEGMDIGGVPSVKRWMTPVLYKLVPRLSIAKPNMIYTRVTSLGRDETTNSQLLHQTKITRPSSDLQEVLRQRSGDPHVMI